MLYAVRSRSEQERCCSCCAHCPSHITARLPPAAALLAECLHPALLRLAVIHVQRQCQVVPGGGGRRLTTGECQQLLSAGRRAYAD